MKNHWVAVLGGFLFALGLAVAGMTQPQNILNFLDLFGNWDWRLLLVMAGGIGVNFVAYQVYIKRNRKPLLGDFCSLPTKKTLDKRLIIGAVIFGAGWGVGGICPGPAIASLGSMQIEIFVFTLAMLIGMLIFKLTHKS